MACNKNNTNDCNFNNCGCDFGVKIFGSCNTSNIILDATKPNTLNWTEISVPEILCVPDEKPDIEHIDQVHAKTEITSIKLLETPYSFASTIANIPLLDSTGAIVTLPDKTIAVGEANVVFYLDPITTTPNQEGTCLTGRKLIIEGNLSQKVVYTANVDEQSVHSANYKIPFSAFIIPYVNIESTPLTYTIIDPTDAGAILTLKAYRATDFTIDLCEDFCVDSYIEDVFITPVDCRTMFKNVTLFLRARPVPQCGGTSYPIV